LLHRRKQQYQQQQHQSTARGVIAEIGTVISQAVVVIQPETATTAIDLIVVAAINAIPVLK